ncbi:MAG: Fe-S protein assembly co-chaperone HscB [Bacteroidetes bacterium]|nr:Fe-S protein assembly co-chaperone HscB [Bacteroidota bacterium]
MNHFELYQIPISFQPDLVLVKKRFYQLSREFHPDFFAHVSEEEKEKILTISAQVNKAYQIFQDEQALIKYILIEKGLLVEEEKYQLSPGFLIEVMDLNELLMDASDSASKEGIRASILTLQNNIYEPVKAIITNYQEGISTEKELLQVKDYYYQKKYLDRILVEL